MHRGGETANTQCERFSIRSVRLCDAQRFPPRDRTGIGRRGNLTRRQNSRAFARFMTQRGNLGSDIDSVPGSGVAVVAPMPEALSP